MSELLPCPLCGEAMWVDRERRPPIAFHPGASCLLGGFQFEADYAPDVEAWNRRADSETYSWVDRRAPSVPPDIQGEPVAWRYRIPSLLGAEWMIVQGRWPEEWDPNWEREPLYTRIPTPTAPAPDAAVEAAVKLVEEMIDAEKHPNARMALAIAARTIRRGRHLTEAEKWENLRRAMSDESQP